MIYDHIQNIARYQGISGTFSDAVRYLLSLDIKSLKPGSLPHGGFDMQKGYGFLETYLLKDPEDCLFEAHQRMIDIQLIVKGRERIDAAVSGELAVHADYDPDKDIVFYRPPGSFITLDLTPGMFAVFFPEDQANGVLGDAHRPCCKSAGETASTKLVLKVSAG